MTATGSSRVAFEEAELEAFRTFIERAVPFHELLGVKLVSIEPGKCSLMIPFRPELLGDVRRNALHGGVLSMLADACGGFAVWSMCSLTDKIATIDMRVDYLKPAVQTGVVAVSEVRLLGNRVGNASTILHPEGDPGHILAEGRAVYNIRRG